jgi:UDP:flavonoid glycosyltransferase YjiC (YdhE family)
MARFLIGTMPVTGHVNPGLPIARALVARGHEVAWYAGARFRERVEAAGARYLPMVHATDFDDRDFEATFPDIARLKGLPRLRHDLKHVFADAVPGQVRDLKEILKTFPADVTLADSGFAGPGRLHERGEGPPWAVFNISAYYADSVDTAPFGLGLPPDDSPRGRLRNRLLRVLCDEVLFRDVHAHYRNVRRSIGLPGGAGGLFASQLSPFLFLQSSVPGFEYRRSDLPPQVHFIGASTPEEPSGGWERPAWWRDLSSGKPVVLLTQGTLATNFDQLLRPALEALAGEDVLVVVTTANKPLEGPVPANARVAGFLHYGELMPHVDLLVTNGGYGTVQMALAHGVPIVASGATEDKPEVCQRVEWAGVGIRIRERRPTPDAIRTAVRQILGSPRFKARAEALRAEYARHDAPTEAAQLLERLAATGQPVFREADDRATEPTQAPQPKL